MLELREHEMCTTGDFAAELCVFVPALEVLGVNDVRPKGFEGSAPRDRLVETKGRPAVGSCDHEHIVPGVSRLVARPQRRPHAHDGRVAVDDSHSSAGREGAPLREGLILDADLCAII